MINFSVFIFSNAIDFRIYFEFLSAVHALWWNENADSRAAGRHRSHEDPRVVSAGKLHHWAWAALRTNLI